MNHFIDHVKYVPVIVALLLLAAYCAYGWWRARLECALARDAETFANRRVARPEKDYARPQAAINEWRMVANVLREDNRALLHDLAYWQARRGVIYCAWWTKQRAPRERRVTAVRVATLGMGRG